jgi:hypothetical protein
MRTRCAKPTISNRNEVEQSNMLIAPNTLEEGEGAFLSTVRSGAGYSGALPRDPRGAPKLRDRGAIRLA